MYHGAQYLALSRGAVQGSSLPFPSLRKCPLSTIFSMYISFFLQFSYVLCLLKNLLGWLWLIRSYRFQVYFSMVPDLYIALCAHHPKFDPLYLLQHPIPLPSGNHHTVVCVCEFFFVWFSCFLFYCFQFYIPHEWNHMNYVLIRISLHYASLRDLIMREQRWRRR